MKEEFPDCELFALACGPSQTPISVKSCVVNGVRFVVYSRDERRTTQNNGICSPGPDGEMYYGQLEQIFKFSYLAFKTVSFRVKWFNTSNKGQDDPDVIHVDNSSDLALSTSLNELEITTLHIDGQSIDVDAPPDIIDMSYGVTATQFDLRPHMESDGWPQIYAGIQQHLQTIYNGKKAALKERYWVPEEDGTYDLECIRPEHPSHIFEMETSATREYPSLIHTFFLTHTVGGVFLNPEDKALYDEMLRLWGLGSNTPTGVPYTEDEIMAIVRRGKQRGYILGVRLVLPGQGTVIPPPSQSTHSVDIVRLKKSEKRLMKQVNMFKRLIRSDDKFSQMVSQLESQPEYGGGSGVAGARMMS
nr:S-adenosyl-L-methionine-dependent methyltransferases superfamily protein [Tanacetum cinerariifolium]